MAILVLWLGQERARRSARSRSGLELARSRSIAAWVRFQIGTAAAKSDRPVGVNAIRRLRLSVSSTATVTRLRRLSGLRLAVSVVRSMASKAATLPMLGGFGRLSDIS